MEYKVSEAGRIDKVLSELSGISRSKIQKQIKNQQVLVNDKVVSANYLVKENDVIFVIEKTLEGTPFVPLSIDIDVVYENENLLIINKPSGLVVHPAPGHAQDTLVNALVHRYQLSSCADRPGIVHRLDKDTSGLMIVAKNDEMHQLLTEMLKNKEVKRCYLAIVDGVISHETGTIDAPIGRDTKNRQKMAVTSICSKTAITNFKVLERFKNKTLIECILETGRTHQIRVHLSYIGYPVCNDPLYGKNKNASEFGQMLHSKSIDFIEPITQEHLHFEIDPPKEFLSYLQSCEKEEDAL